MLLVGTLLALLVGQEATRPADEAPRARGWGDFPVLVWRERYAGKPLPDVLAEPFGGVLLMRGEDSRWARERGLSYLVWNVAGRDALHLDGDEAWNARVERWIATREERWLVREPCLNDPGTVARLRTTLDATLERHGEHPGLGFVLGDEVGLTPNGDPFDLCRCGSCEAAWREHARENGWPERAPLTDEVRLALLEDDTSLLGAWLARRRFDQLRLLELLDSLAERARGREGRRVALLGLKGRTAFGGVDVRAASRSFEVLEAYAVGDSRALLESPPALGAGEERRAFQHSLSTLFVRDESPQGAAWLAWESWMRGSDALVLWKDADLERDPETLARLASAVRAIREVAARSPVPLERPLTHLGLVSDGDSLAVSWLREALSEGPTWPRLRQSHQEAHGTRERSIRGWLGLADALGLAVEALAPTEVPRATSGVLVLVDLQVLDPEDATRLEAYLDRGGTLILDGALAWVDRRGRPWREPLEERLEALAPERVLRASAGAFADGRLDARKVEGLRSALGLSRAEDARLFALAGGAERHPWLVRSFSGHSFSGNHGSPPPRVCILLPDARSAEERARLSALPLELRSARRVEWLHPATGGILPAGDAAVLVLHEVAKGR